MEQSDTAAVPQWKPLTGTMVQNSAGGYSWTVNDVDRLRRFLCIGSEGEKLSCSVWVGLGFHCAEN